MNADEAIAEVMGDCPRCGDGWRSQHVRAGAMPLGRARFGVGQRVRAVPVERPGAFAGREFEVAWIDRGPHGYSPIYHLAGDDPGTCLAFFEGELEGV